MELFTDSKQKLDQCTEDLQDKSQRLEEAHKDLKETRQRLTQEEFITTQLQTTENKLYSTAGQVRYRGKPQTTITLADKRFVMQDHACNEECSVAAEYGGGEHGRRGRPPR